MKTFCSIVLCLLFFSIHSQSDSTGRYIKGVQVEISSAPWIMYDSPSQEELQEIAPPGIFLNRDLSGFTKQDLAWINTPTFQGMAGFKLFFRETHISETFFGLRYGQALIAGTSYNQIITDTIDSAVDPITGSVELELIQNEYLFNYSVFADRLYFPIGINFFTSQKRLFWASAGVELCPFLNFSYLFQSGISYYRWEETVLSGQSPTRSLPFIDSGYYSKYQKMDEMSVGGYIGVPMAVHIHPFFMKTGTMQHLHIFATLLPVFAFNSSEFGKPSTAASLVVNAGIRYNLK